MWCSSQDISTHSPLWVVSPRGGEMNILKGKNVSMRQMNFHLLSQTKLSSTNMWLLKVYNFRLVPPL
jgi:hypothetical protein